jgi:hypothetical protein
MDRPGALDIMMLLGIINISLQMPFLIAVSSSEK